MKPSDEALTGLLLRALNSPVGIRIKTNDANRLRADLYKIRKRDPDFAALTLTIADPVHLFIVKKQETLDAPEEN